MGFHYFAQFARPKQSLSTTIDSFPAPPPPFEPAPGEKLVQSIEALDDGEVWETTLAKRRIKTGFAIPLKVKFPKKNSLATDKFYATKPEQLSRLNYVDFYHIFNVATWVDCIYRDTKDA